ncbi:MAG TPA: hypothetical protein VG167_06040 [Verrucomicrobiae bacterium]|nr:hypothetical protein [Verrucomicrobiae bacterium]
MPSKAKRCDWGFSSRIGGLALRGSKEAKPFTPFLVWVPEQNQPYRKFWLSRDAWMIPA